MPDKMCCFVEGTVVSELHQTEKYRAIHELIARAPVFKNVDDILEFESAVVNRERSISTGLGHGVAMAHGKSRAVRNFFIALGRSRAGIDFDTPDGLPVHFLFLVATPPDYQDEYLSAVSALSGLLRDSDFRDKLMEIKTSQELENTLSEAFSTALECRCSSYSFR